MTWLTGNRKEYLKNNNNLAPLNNRDNIEFADSLTGFSLFELLIIIIIMMSLLTFSLPRLRSTFNNLKFDSFSQKLVSRMRYLQERASFEQTIYRLKFDLDNRYVVIEQKNNDSGNFTTATGILGRRINIPRDFEIKLPQPYLTFLPDGSLNGKDIQIYYQERNATISIKESIGRIILKND